MGKPHSVSVIRKSVSAVEIKCVASFILLYLLGELQRVWRDVLGLLEKHHLRSLCSACRKLSFFPGITLVTRFCISTYD